MSKLKTNFLMLALAVVSAIVPNPAFAQIGVVGETVCTIYTCIVDNNMLLAIASISILFLGIGAFFGKVNWGLVIIITLGIVVITGAMQIASSFTDISSCSGGSLVSC